MPASSRYSHTLHPKLRPEWLGIGFAGFRLHPRLPLGQTGNTPHKPIPATGETLPAIGLGTWRTFNLGNDRRLIDARTEVVRAFFTCGGGMDESSPMMIIGSGHESPCKRL